MAETVYGGELNIHAGGFITLNEIKDADDYVFRRIVCFNSRQQRLLLLKCERICCCIPSSVAGSSSSKHWQ